MGILINANDLMSLVMDGLNDHPEFVEDKKARRFVFSYLKNMVSRDRLIPIYRKNCAESRMLSRFFDTFFIAFYDYLESVGQTADASKVINFYVNSVSGYERNFQVKDSNVIKSIINKNLSYQLDLDRELTHRITTYIKNNIELDESLKYYFNYGILSHIDYFIGNDVLQDAIVNHGNCLTLVLCYPGVGKTDFCNLFGDALNCHDADFGRVQDFRSNDRDKVNFSHMLDRSMRSSDNETVFTFSGYFSDVDEDAKSTALSIRDFFDKDKFDHTYKKFNVICVVPEKNHKPRNNVREWTEPDSVHEASLKVKSNVSLNKVYSPLGTDAYSSADLTNSTIFHKALVRELKSYNRGGMLFMNCGYIAFSHTL